MNEKPRKVEAEALVVRRIGNSVGLILPKELLARFNIQEGDKLFPVEGPDRELKLAPYDPKHQQTMTVARQLFREYADTFKALAK